MDFVFVFCDMFFYVYRLKINSLNNSIQELLGSSETCGPQSVGTFPYQTITCSAIGSILGVTTRYWHTARQCRTLLPTFSGEQQFVTSECSSPFLCKSRSVSHQNIPFLCRRKSSTRTRSESGRSSQEEDRCAALHCL